MEISCSFNYESLLDSRPPAVEVTMRHLTSLSISNEGQDEYECCEPAEPLREIIGKLQMPNLQHIQATLRHDYNAPSDLHAVDWVFGFHNRSYPSVKIFDFACPLKDSSSVRVFNRVLERLPALQRLTLRSWNVETPLSNIRLPKLRTLRLVPGVNYNPYTTQATQTLLYLCAKAGSPPEEVSLVTEDKSFVDRIRKSYLRVQWVINMSILDD